MTKFLYSIFAIERNGNTYIVHFSNNEQGKIRARINKQGAPKEIVINYEHKTNGTKTNAIDLVNAYHNEL